MRALINSLPAEDQDLLREIETERMAELDEDALLKLHKRVRRARNKSVKNYRRQAAAGIEDHGGRGAGHPKNTRARDRAEVYEDALAQVSARVEVLARQASAELRAERLAAARQDRDSGPELGRPDAAPAPERIAGTAKKTTGGLKKDASTRAEGARRQAKRDTR
ncbi:hypothetical protein [Nocardioides sp. Iso805N]|uniref:hypothetical protein n=1 Tax=Nocardioides sp. Iso805N TaxID=1283287 RepID=UPI00036AD290|nr:hypothetical protein [Nocardioides sp. Iso805N]